MASNTITITAFSVTNRTERELNLMLEPEGDVVQVPIGKSCLIKAEVLPESVVDGEVDCEVECGPNGDITLYLAITKQAYLDGVRIR